MKKKTLFALTLGLVLTLIFTLALLAKESTFQGKISDSRCGVKHRMPGLSDKDCTVACVKKGAKDVLADEANNKVHKLDNQAKAESFPGESVTVKGSLQKDGKTIHVISIEAAK